EGGEVGHIGKQHGDLAALPFERTAGRQNLLGQVPRRVALELRLLVAVDLRQRGWRADHLRYPQRRATLAAEFKRGLSLCTAVGAAPFQLGPTLDAEVHGRRIVELAAWTSHRSLLRSDRHCSAACTLGGASVTTPRATSWPPASRLCQTPR